MTWLLAPLVAFVVTAPIRHVDRAGLQKVRQAAVAGSFYPADPKELSTMIDDMLVHAAPQPVDGPIIAAVAPHAGYPYSGPVAAWTYAALKGHKYSRVVVMYIASQMPLLTASRVCLSEAVPVTLPIVMFGDAMFTFDVPAPP